MIRNYASKTVADLSTQGKLYVHVARMLDREDEGDTIPAAVIMPPTTLAIRAGEYGLDPADTQLLLDVVLHETFISYPDNEHPLWTAPSIQEARERHLDEVATVRRLHEKLGADWPRPKNYPSPAAHRAALVRAAELSPIHAGAVLAGRSMARTAWRMHHGLRSA
jgi:hypothetical protein